MSEVTKTKKTTKYSYKFYEPKKGLAEKVCSITGKKLPIDNFWKDKYMKDGYTSYSKEGYKLRWIVKDPKFIGKKYQSMNRE